MGKKKAHEDYVAQLSEINSNIEVVEKYVNCNTKILHRCKIDGYEWYAIPSNILSGHGCPECMKREIHNRFAKSHEDYVKEVLNINSDIEVIGKYINNSTPILHRCNRHNIEWYISPSHILEGCGCTKCKREKIYYSKVKNIETYKNEVRRIDNTIEVVGEYVNARTPILHKCLICENEWYTIPDSILSGSGCPKCAYKRISKNRMKSHNEFIEELSYVNKDIMILEEYQGATTKILCQCLRDNCGHQWYATPDSLLAGHGCPFCTKSYGEKEISRLLVENNINFIPQYTFDDCKNTYALPFDFYLPDYYACIEYDGIQHFKPIDFFGGQQAFEDTQKRDAIKTNYCKANNIPLLRIRYDEDIVSTLENFLSQYKINTKEAAS